MGRPRAAASSSRPFATDTMRNTLLSYVKPHVQEDPVAHPSVETVDAFLCDHGIRVDGKMRAVLFE